MRKVALRGLFARKLRLTLTTLAIALGVMLVSGTYLFTDTINASFDRIFQESSKGTDASVTPKQSFETDFGATAEIPPSVVQQVRDVPGVAAAEGSVFDEATVLGRDGERIGAGGAPNFVTSLRPGRFEEFKVTKGRAPQTADEVAIDTATAREEDFELGDRVAVQGDAPRKDYEIVGLTQIAGVDSLGGATAVVMLPAEALRVLGKEGYDEIEAAAEPGVTPQELKARLRAALPASLTVRTGQEEADKQSQDIRDELGFLTTALLAFAGISLFVGAFLIFNTFSITVAQRAREFGLLRALGASRAQILRSVVGEGLVLGAFGALAGLALGFGVAPGLRAIFKAVGVDLPSQGTVVEARTIVVSLVIGVGVTVVSSIAPAVRATRVAPVAALHEGFAPVRSRPRVRTTVIAALLTAAGVALMCIGLFAPPESDSSTLALMGGGAAGTFVGVALLSPWLVRPLASLTGMPLERAFGITGRLARANAIRQPGRTAATAAALMIGVALVTFASIFAAGARDTIAKAVDDNFRGDFVVQNDNGFAPFSAQATQAVRDTDGVAAASAVRFSTARVGGVTGEKSVSGIDPETFTGVYEADVSRGGRAALERLDDRSVLLDKGFAEDNGKQVGDTLTLESPIGRTLRLRVTGVLDDNGNLTADLTMTNTVLRSAFDEGRDAIALVKLDDGADQEAVQRAIATRLDRDFPEAEVLTAEEFKDEQAGQVNDLLGLIYALLSLAIIVSLFGIVNTLALSIAERTRELGMLRAIGTSRRQVKRMVRYEAVITSLIGAVLGMVLGVVLAVLFTRPLEDFSLSVPVADLVVVLVLSGVAGVLAAVLPARRAARLDVLEALAYE